MDLKKLKKLVVLEATALKQHASVSELQELDLKNLDSKSSYSCIYGQMVGHCSSPRALELMRLAGARVYKGGLLDAELSRLRKMPMSTFDNWRAPSSWSPIEIYITQEGAKTENLINFLQGDINQVLTVNDL